MISGWGIVSNDICFQLISAYQLTVGQDVVSSVGWRAILSISGDSQEWIGMTQQKKSRM
jgi:hypothetical protein